MKNLEQLRKNYLESASKKAKEGFDYFQIGDAFNAGANLSNSIVETFFNEFMKKIGPHIQGLDNEEIYDIYKNVKDNLEA